MTTVTSTVLTFATAGGGDGFTAPGPADFNLPPAFEIGGFGVTKPMLLLALSVVVVFVFFFIAVRNAKVVPGKLQFAAEFVYGGVRNSIARDSIGSADYLKYVPYLFTLFTFLLVNNYYALVPFLQFPTLSRIGYAIPLAVLSWLVYNGAGIARKGFLGYLKHQSVPAGVSGPVLGLLIPLEFISNILIRPVTLALRIFANLFAGHILLMLFAIGGAYLIFESGNPWYAPVGVLSFVLGIGVSFLEMLVLFLQAYVFTLLTAMYIGSAISDEH